MFSLSSPLQLMLRRRRAIFVVGAIAAALSAAVSFLWPLEYRADAQVLIISRSRYGVDPYTVVKSAERVGENIAQVMKTDDFFGKVMEEKGYNFDTKQFTSVDTRTKRKLWERTVTAAVVYGTGVLNVSVYQTNPDSAKELAAAVVDTLAAKGWEYVGGDVTIKVVNAPLVTRLPVRPNIVVNALVGFLAGIVAMVVLILKQRL